MRSLFTTLFAFCCCALDHTSACADPISITPVGRWSSVWHDDGVEIRVVLVFAEDGTFVARNDRTAKPLTARCGTTVIKGTWTVNDGIVTAIPKTFDPPDEAVAGLIVIYPNGISGSEITITDSTTGGAFKLRREAEPGATDNPGDAQ